MGKVKNIYITCILIPFLFMACMNTVERNKVKVTNLVSGFSIYQDTIYVDIKGEMTHAIKYHDKYYVLFEQKLLMYGGYGKRWLCMFSNGKLEKTIDCPKNLQITSLDFFVKNDSIILKPYMNDNTYYFDIKNDTGKKIEKVDDLIFEDERYFVYSLDFGEWGGKTWFKDKKSSFEYVLEDKTPLINKIDTTYYLTNKFWVLKIDNPSALHKCDKDITYENIELSGKKYSWYSEPVGYNVIYQDSLIFKYEDKNLSQIITSFVWNNELIHIYKTDTMTYLAKNENKSIKLIDKIGNEFDFFDFHFSYRCKNLNGQNELLKFKSKNKQVFGLIDIIDNKLNIHYFANKAELAPTPKGQVNADLIFKHRLDFLLLNFNHLTFKDIIQAEQEWKSFDITPNHIVGVGNSWNPQNLTIDENKAYLIQEDTIISNSIMYFGSKTTNLVGTVTLNWERITNKLYNPDNQENEMFEKKFNFIETKISQKAGTPFQKKEDNDNIERVWRYSNGVIIELFFDKKYNQIRLVVFKGL